MRGALARVGMRVTKLWRPGEIQQIEVKPGSRGGGLSAGLRSRVCGATRSSFRRVLRARFASGDGEKKRDRDRDDSQLHASRIAASWFLPDASGPSPRPERRQNCFLRGNCRIDHKLLRTPSKTLISRSTCSTLGLDSLTHLRPIPPVATRADLSTFLNSHQGSIVSTPFPASKSLR